MGHKHTDGLIPCPSKRREALRRAVSGTLTKNAKDRVKRFAAGKDKLSASFLIVNGELEREKKGDAEAAAEKMIILDFLKRKRKKTLMQTCKLFLSQMTKEGKQIVKTVNGGIHEITMRLEDEEDDNDEEEEEEDKEEEEEEEEEDQEEEEEED